MRAHEGDAHDAAAAPARKRRVSGHVDWERRSWEGGRRQRPASQEICYRQRSRASASGGVSWRV